MANALVLGLINVDGFTMAEAKWIFRQVRDHGYSLEEAKNAVKLAKQVDLTKPIQTFTGVQFVKTEAMDEPTEDGPIREDVEEVIEEPKQKKRVKAKARKTKHKGKKK